ncbi:MAG: nucleoside-triphosphatase [Planctomycetes bacterium]|nr:nucleoside-triphosphatase [Planctomycetota bacterium]
MRPQEPSILLGGRPRIGKTTIVRQQPTYVENIRLAAFRTEEICEDGRRARSRAVTFSRESAVLADLRLAWSRNLRGPVPASSTGCRR